MPRAVQVLYRGETTLTVVEIVARVALTAVILVCGGLGIWATVPFGATAGGWIVGTPAVASTFGLLGIGCAALSGAVARNFTKSVRLRLGAVILGLLLGVFCAVSIGAGPQRATNLALNVVLFGSVTAAVAVSLVFGIALKLDATDWKLVGWAATIFGGLCGLASACFVVKLDFPGGDAAHFATFMAAVIGILLGLLGGAGGIGIGFLLAIPLAGGFSAWALAWRRDEPVLLYFAVVLLPAGSRAQRLEEWRAHLGALPHGSRRRVMLELLRAVFILAIDDRRS
jgi:hypothetical protein